MVPGAEFEAARGEDLLIDDDNDEDDEEMAPCIRIGGMKDNFVSDTFRHFFGQKWHLSHQNTQLKAYFG